jgi:general secretion pathway protein A
VRYDLKPLSADEVIAYIEHRLLVAGGPGKIKFTKGAYRAVYDLSEGIPRRINALCDRALLIAYAKNISRIDRRVIRHAARDIGSEYFQKTISSGRKLWLRLTT